MAKCITSSKLADIPLAKPGFDALGITAPILVNLNPNGEWERIPPKDTDEKQLKNLVQYLMKSQAVSAAQSYCTQCADENVKTGKPKCVPIIMMPIMPADQCPFDMECEIQKLKEAEQKTTKKTTNDSKAIDMEKDKDSKKSKKRWYLQRLTDFDLMSQW